jgi:hypothetical protein
MAPSGKAAVNVNGTTIHTGFRIPVSKDRLVPYKKLEGEPLRTMQSEFASVKMLIIDEYSMISQKLFTELEARCREAKSNEEPFGGMAVILVGDPAQLSPVAGTSLWHLPPRQLPTNRQLQAKMLYELFQDTVKLEGSNRIIDENGDGDKQFFESFLESLRNGTIQIEQWNIFNSKVTKEAHRARLLQSGSFFSFFNNYIYLLCLLLY